jgi:hypothetical protein
MGGSEQGDGVSVGTGPRVKDDMRTKEGAAIESIAGPMSRKPLGQVFTGMGAQVIADGHERLRSSERLVTDSRSLPIHSW